jgi:lysophospholipase L1-like esterase
MMMTTAAVVVALASPVRAEAPDPTTATTSGVRSVAVLGDSVAAGEGTLAGYAYRDRALLPGWAPPARAAATEPATDARCGRSPRAYGALVAAALGAEVANLACSGASFEQGIALDAQFDAARPDLVLVTAGANSVAFERAFAYCVLASRGLSEREATRIATASTVEDAVSTAFAVTAQRLIGSAGADRRATCTARTPGAYLEQTVLDRADAVGNAARRLATSIRARGRALGVVPDVVFTTYPDPLPRVRASFVECPDAAGLGPDQLAFLRDMARTLNAALRDALADAPGVRIADPDDAFVGHRWCDADPWFYGPSIFVADPSSRVPFHPTPAGQRAIADAVLAVLAAGDSAAAGPV